MSEMITKTRRLPTKGEVYVSKGEMVQPDTVIAGGTVLNPEIVELKLFTQLKVDPEYVKNYLTKSEGDQVSQDEVIGVSRSFFTRQTRVARSPIDGKIESFSSTTGRMMIRGSPIKMEVSAYIPGTVKEVLPDEGAVIETSGTRLEGLFGIGGEAFGELVRGVDSPEMGLSAADISPEYKGKVIIGGALASLDALREAVKVGASGVIVGGVDQKDLTYFLGYEIGVPVTGGEETGLTVILTDGFGVNPMDQGLFDQLSSSVGVVSCINGATHIRSRSIRPEIIIPTS
jgi:hypothetical protein